MASLRDYVSNGLVPAITEDARKLRIFNEADLQFRVAYHLERGYVAHAPGLYLLNQPFIRIGAGRGAVRAKPDIVIADEQGPFFAFELKCYFENTHQKLSTIIDSVLDDIDQLRKFKLRFKGSQYGFALVMVDIPDVDAHRTLVSALPPRKEPWMAHFLKVHVVNLYCDENHRKRTRYEQWSDDWSARREQVSV